ncbi:hypothetical protein [Curtobacterium sp. VKM Ac-2852]|uniref:hypothetical protein n=1 Tax=Curtobacterium sp. VKM Ac-2852 TaxID=2739024 RepID=UPI0015648B5A|nr:hypothetical protein [Curtobacterium sp. VKM Ac-2852]NQX25676.1 hypothetical protein [Curtobacterium sp. VKM Ac-2852]
MAENRKSTTQAAARKAARERAAKRAAEFRRRQDQLEELAVEYFVASDAVDAIEVAAEQEVAKIRARAAERVVGEREKATSVIARMLATGVTRHEVAARIGVAVRQVPRAKPLDTNREVVDTHSEHARLTSSQGAGEQETEHGTPGDLHPELARAAQPEAVNS